MIQYYNLMTSDPIKRRSLKDRVMAIFNFIEMQTKPFPKSRLKEIGINPRAAEKWLSLIEFIQSQPKIRLVKTERNTIIEKVEGKYEAHMRKRFTDESIPFEDRIQDITNYLKALYQRERTQFYMPSNPPNGYEEPKTNEKSIIEKDKNSI